MLFITCFAPSEYAFTSPPMPKRVPPNHRVTVKKIFVASRPFKTSRTGRPAVPEGSPSSLIPLISFENPVTNA